MSSGTSSWYTSILLPQKNLWCRWSHNETGEYANIGVEVVLSLGRFHVRGSYNRLGLHWKLPVLLSWHWKPMYNHFNPTWGCAVHYTPWPGVHESETFQKYLLNTSSQDVESLLKHSGEGWRKSYSNKTLRLQFLLTILQMLVAWLSCWSSGFNTFSHWPGIRMPIKLSGISPTFLICTFVLLF